MTTALPNVGAWLRREGPGAAFVLVLSFATFRVFTDQWPPWAFLPLALLGIGLSQLLQVATAPPHRRVWRWRITAVLVVILVVTIAGWLFGWWQ